MERPQQPSTPRSSFRTTGLRVGDSVTLPGGQTAILKFIGKIQGKPGEYAGVELVGDDASQGKHSGSFNGITYFTTSQPNSGLFITYSKLIGANSVTKSPNILRTPSSRNSAITRSVHLPPSQPDLAVGSSTRGKPPTSPTRKVSSVTKPRKSLASAPTITNLSPVKKPGSAMAGTPIASDLSPTAGARRMRSSTTVAPGTPSQRRTSTLHSRRISIASTSEGGSSGPSVEEFATLTRELREARNAMADKDAQLEHQSQILREMEQSLGELEKIAMANGSRSTGMAPAQNEDVEALLRTIDEKDKKISSMKTEFEEKRKEFRDTIDGLQVEIQDTSDLYEADIRRLKQGMGQATEVTRRVAELEQIVDSLESGLKSSQISEQNARIQLSRLADVENRLLDKEQQINDAGLEIDRYKKLLEESQVFQQNENDFTSSNEIITSLQNEKEQLEKQIVTQKDRVSDLEQQVQTLESTLNDLSASNQDEEDKNIDSELIRSLEFENEHLKKTLNDSQATVKDLETKIASKHGEKGPKTDDANIELIQEIKLYKSKVKELEQEIHGLENMLETKLFRETELEKELDTLKMRSNASSTTTTFTSPTTPRTDETDLTDPIDTHHHEASDYQSPVRVSDPASGRKLWCGLCEREGHESLDCPYEEEF